MKVVDPRTSRIILQLLEKEKYAQRRPAYAEALSDLVSSLLCDNPDCPTNAE